MKIYTKKELKEILKNHRDWLDGIGGVCADLSHADLSGANLSDADLSGANLSDANLSGTYLGGANLSDADLRHANLIGADLRRSNLSGSNLIGADLIGADLSGADLSDAILRHVNLSHADLSGSNLIGADLRRSNLSGADLSHADLSGSNLIDTNLIGANLSNAKGLLNPIEYIMENFERNEQGIIVYKSFGLHYTPNPNWEMAEGTIIEEVVNPLPTVACGCGVNVATKEWVERRCCDQVWKCLIKWEWLAGVVVPYQTDGQIRASKVQLIEPVELL